MKTECKGEVGDYCRCWRINVGQKGSFSCFLMFMIIV